MRPLVYVLKCALVLSLTYCLPAAACIPTIQPIYDPVSYYAMAQGLAGDNLKAALNTIVRGHQSYSYTPCTWEMLKQADEDPNNPNNVIALYSQRSIPKADQDQGGNTPDYWNREHVWPKSHGFPSKSQHAYTDGHMLRPADKSINSDRSDKDFAEGGSANSECSLCSETSYTWEPPDLVKGDIARIMFYMVVRYEGSDSSGVPDLELVDALTSSGEARMGKLCELLQWHLDDPVTSREISRNDIIFSWQGNRNPFIDHPEYALPIWGPACGIELVEETLPIDEHIPLPPWAYATLAMSLMWLGRNQLFKR